MRTVSAASVAANPQGIEGLPPAVHNALGELASAAKEGLLAMSVGVGLGVLCELLEDEVELATYAHFAARDRLTDVMLERMLAGVSTRRYARTGEPVGGEVDEVARSTSKSAVSREFVSRTREQLIDLMSRPLDDLRLAVLMLDGIDLKGRCCIVALGIDSDGVKHPLGLWDGSTENATVATTLLANLVERGLDVEQGVLVVLDGAKALRKAIRDVLG